MLKKRKRVKNRIRELRKSIGLNQTELASRCGVEQRTLSLWENDMGDPSPDALDSMSNMFSVPIDYILGKSESPIISDKERMGEPASNRIKELREARGISQFELATICKVAQGAISDWEIGIRMPNISALMLMADYFSVPIDYILMRQSNQIGELLSEDELMLTSLYRGLDSDGQKFILRIVKRESQRVNQSSEFVSQLESMQSQTAAKNGANDE